MESSDLLMSKRPSESLRNGDGQTLPNGSEASNACEAGQKKIPREDFVEKDVSAKIKEIISENADDFLAKYDTFLVDCDGVIWKTDHHTNIPGIAPAIKKIRDMGKRLLFVSNNSIYSRQTYAEKLQKHGYEVEPEHIFCVSHAAAVYLKKVKKINTSVYVIGTEKMERELNEGGITNFGADLDPDPPFKTLEDVVGIERRKDVGAVLVGVDAHFNMNKLCKASTYLTDPKCIFLATDDHTKGVVIPQGICVPMSGAIIDAVKSASGREPVVLGKPHALLFDCIRADYPSVERNRTVMIGDTLDTDIQFAHNVGVDSALVLTGITKSEKMAATSGPRPTYFMKSLSVLGE